MSEPVCECGHFPSEHVEECRECEVEIEGERCRCLMYDEALNQKKED